jgi:hypothetical protein
MEVPLEWGYNPIKMEKRRLRDLLNTVALLRSGDVRGAGIIGAYHARGVAPLMAQTLSLYKMTPDASCEGTVLTRGLHRNTEIEQRIREAMDVLNDLFEFSILGHPVMRPDMGFTELVCPFLVSSLGRCFFCYLILRTGVHSLTSTPGPPTRYC